MTPATFMALGHGQTSGSGHHPRRIPALTFACLLGGVLPGCSADQHTSGGGPRDLLPDISIQHDRPVGTDTGRLALLVPLTGPAADLGRQLWDAATLALFDSGRDDVVLLPYDTQGTPAGAAAAAEASVKVGTDAVIGPLFSESVTAARPILLANGVRAISLSNNRAVAGPPFVLIGADPETQMDAVASYLASSGRDRILLFGPDTPYLQLLRQRLILLDQAGKLNFVESRLYRSGASYTDIAKEIRAATRYDQRVAALKEFTAIFTASWESHDDPETALLSALERLSRQVETIRLQLAGFSSEATVDRKKQIVSEAEYSDALAELLQIYHKNLKVKGMPRDAMFEAAVEFERRETLGAVDFDAVLLPIGGKPLLVIAPMFAYFNASSPNVWLLGTDTWESIGPRPPKDLLGARYVTPVSRGGDRFQTRFHAVFGYRPDSLAAAAYDAVNVAIAEKQETGQTFLTESFITRHAGFSGVNGRFRFLPDGTAQRSLEIVELGQSGTDFIFTWTPDQPPEVQHAPVPAALDAVPPAAPTQPLPPLSTLDNAKSG